MWLLKTSVNSSITLNFSSYHLSSLKWESWIESLIPSGVQTECKCWHHGGEKASDSLTIAAISGGRVKWLNERTEDGMVCGGVEAIPLIKRCPW